MANVTSRDVLLQTEQMDAAAAFYHDSLGMTHFMREPRMIGLEGGGFRLFIEQAEPLGPVFEFFVTDLEAARAALLAKGCHIEAEDASVPKCYVRDPYGLIFNIAERNAVALLRS